MNMTKRPKLTSKLDADFFRQWYWLKKELTDFCSAMQLSSAGMKPEIMERIYAFLKTGQRLKPIRQKCTEPDSHKPLTMKTVVKNYKNDPETRNFFIKHIGSHFKFSARVNIFRKEAQEKGEKITYGDLMNVWLHEYEQRRNKTIKLPIMKSCEYNQFTRDFYAANPNASRKRVISAWKQARTLAGAHTYQAWVKAFN